MQQTPLQDINTHLQADIIPLSARNDFWPTYFNGIKGWQTFEVVSSPR